MDDYIPKPVDWDVLLETLERWTTHPATEGDRSSNPTKFATMSHNSADLNRPSRSSSQTRAPLPPSSSDSSGNPPISNHDSDESNPCLEPSQMSQDSPKPQIPLDLERLVRVSRGKVSLQKRLLQAFVDATQTDLENLRAIVDDQDGDRITEIAHRLKGAAANVGATVMSEQSADLEQAAKEQNFEQVESYLQRLLEQWQQIKQFLETLELS